MRATKKNTCGKAGAQINIVFNEDSNKSSKKKPCRETKLQRVLRALMTRSYNRFEAAKELADWCLHSTVADIQSKGILVSRKFEIVSGYQGIPTRCCRYWISADQRTIAAKLLRKESDL